MLSDRSRQALIDIRDNCLLAKSFIAGKSADEFQSDQKLFYAVTRCLEIVSEASRRLDHEVRQRHPDLPWWPNIASAGNIYRHVYHNLTATEVWVTATKDIDPLLAMVETELQQ
jgi:uncharacterized protein with HEPN domain